MLKKYSAAISFFYHLPKAILACFYYFFPGQKLKIIGVTGTDGKTTTATLIYQILKQAGKKTALISTVAAKIGKLSLPTGFHVTCPGPWQLQKLLKLMVDSGFEYVVIEATSHGLAQYRLWGCNFYLGVVTNITHEHLDYHQTFAKYLAAKAKLVKKAKIVVLNKEDKSFIKLKKLAKGKVISYGFNKADYTLKNFPFKTRLIGKFNLLNCLAAIAAAKSLKIENKVIKQAILKFKGITGRMEEIKNKAGIRIFIDFAHTPNGLKSALLSLKKLSQGKLIAVFGCAGLRDVKKRPMMGKVACSLADKVVLTAEDPRTEKVEEIIKQIKKGCLSKNKVKAIADRQKAINFAITRLAKKGDIVAIFGKGHEKSMCFGRQEYFWSEHQAVKKALKLRQKQ